MRNWSWRRKTGALFALLAGLVVFSGLLAILVYRLGYLDTWLASRIQGKLSEYGIRTEFGQLSSTVRGMKAQARDVKFFVEGAREPFATIANVDVGVSLKDVLGLSGPTEINLRECIVEGVRGKYVIDEQGRSNLDGLHPSDVHVTRFSLKYTSAVLTVKDAEFLYIDRLHKLEGTARQVALNLGPAGEESMRVFAKSRASSFVFDGRDVNDIALDLEAVIKPKGARVESLEVDSGILTARFSGDVKSWHDFDYALDGAANIKLREAAAVFAPDFKLGGTAQINGKLEGRGTEYQLTGKITSPNMLVRDVKLDSLSLTASGTGKGMDARARTEIALAALDAAGFRVNRLSALGEVATTARTFQWKGSAKGQKLAQRDLSVFGMTADRVVFDAPITDLSNYKLSAAVRFDSLIAADVPLGTMAGDVVATPRDFVVTGLKGAAFSGQVDGNARIALVSGGASEFSATLTRLNIDQALAAVAGRRLPLRGLASGKVNLHWSGTRFESATGPIDLVFDGSTNTSQGSAGIPLTGSLHLNAKGREFTIDRTTLRSGSTELAASGVVSADKSSNLAFELTTSDAAELEDLVIAVAEALGDEKAESLASTLTDNEIELAGNLMFKGSMLGTLDNPEVKGHFSVDSVSARRSGVGQFSGDLDLSNSLVKVDNGRLVQADGGNANFSLNYPVNEKNRVSVKLQAQKLEIAPLVRLAGDVRVAGTLTGNADLSGLPGEMRGNGSFVIEKPKYADIAFDDLRGSVTVEGAQARLQGARLRLGENALTIEGSWNTDSDAYQVKASGEGLDIAKMLELGGASKTGLAGKASLVFDASSAHFVRDDKTNRIFDNLSATLTASNLTYKGKDIGQITASATGHDSLANLKVEGKLLEHTYLGTGSIDFSKKEAPANAVLTLNDIALAPVIELLSERAAPAEGVVAGEIRLNGNVFGDSEKLKLEANLTKLEFETNDGKIAGQPPMLIKLGDQQLDLGTLKFSGKDTNLDLQGTLAIGQRGRTALAANGNVNLRVLQSFIKDTTAEGVVQVRMTAGGTFEQPRLSGSATLTGGAFRARDLPVSLTNAQGRFLFTADQAQLESFSANVGGGRLTMTGGAAMSGLALDRWRFEARLNGIRVDYPTDVRTTADGELTLQGNRQAQVLSGLVSVRRAEYVAENDLFDLIEEAMSEFGGASSSQTGGFASMPPTQLDIHVVANDSLAIKNRSLDLVGSADLRVIGTADEPVIKGRVTVSRGLIDDLFREQYRITSGLIDFPGIQERPPRISLEAETVVSGYRLTVLIAGPLDNLKITPRSEPPLPQADVIALMTSGQLPKEYGLDTSSPSQALAQTQSANLATLLTQPLSSRIGSNVTGRLFGLNRFAIDPLVTGRGTDPTARVTVGRRITRDLSITYSTNLASNQDQVILVEYRATERLSFVASRADDGSFGFDIRLRKRF